METKIALLFFAAYNTSTFCMQAPKKIVGSKSHHELVRPSISSTSQPSDSNTKLSKSLPEDTLRQSTSKPQDSAFFIKCSICNMVFTIAKEAAGHIETTENCKKRKAQVSCILTSHASELLAKEKAKKIFNAKSKE